jgi:restriction system protein
VTGPANIQRGIKDLAADSSLGIDLVGCAARQGEGRTGTEQSRLRTGASGDAGIDGVIREDQLGLDSIYVQAKRWGANVGRPVVQAFVGALQGARASKGIIFTASAFSTDARQYAETVSPRVILIDGEKLAGLMFDHNVGVSDREAYMVKRLDGDYFGDDT